MKNNGLEEISWYPKYGDTAIRQYRTLIIWSI